MNVTSMNDTLDKPSGRYSEYSKIKLIILTVVALCLCIVGLVGNVIVFWYLCFKIQRNKYTVYIMNLSVADALYIIFAILNLMFQTNIYIGTDRGIIGKESVYLFKEIFYDTMQYSGMFILTAVSMERCSSVLFPFWYKSHRPRNLSTIMCTSLWILGFLESLLVNFVCTEEAFDEHTSQCSVVQIIVLVLAIGICLPIMVISSITLLIKVNRSLKQRYTPKLYIIIIIAVFVFILSVLPFNLILFLVFFKLSKTVICFYTTTYCTLLNCTINPYIYFIVGRKWKQKTPHSIQEALQRAFREEDDEKDDPNSNNNKNNTSS